MAKTAGKKLTLSKLRKQQIEANAPKAFAKMVSKQIARSDAQTDAALAFRRAAGL